MFYRADELLFTLPPAHSYLQAPFFWLFPAGYGTARLAGWCAGVVTLFLLYRLMRDFEVAPSIAILGVACCGLGRAWYFPWQDSRPDIVCCMFGVAAITLACRARKTEGTREPMLAGLFTGLGGLTHPFAIIFAFQVGGLLLLRSGRLSRRIRSCVISGSAAILVLSLWLPLIAMEPELFRIQFLNNLRTGSGPGLFSRLLFPWEFVPTQALLIHERVGTIQTIVMVTGLLAALVWLRDTRVRLALGLAASSLYLHIASIGHHPTKGYLCYSWAMTVVLIVVVLDRMFQWKALAVHRKSALCIVSATAFILLTPGAGFRTCLKYMTVRDYPQLDCTAFCEAVDQTIPADSRLIVSPEFVFTFELLGRRPVCACSQAFYYSVEGLEYDYLVDSRWALGEGIPELLHSRKINTYGDRKDVFTCYAEIHVSTNETAATRQWPRSTE